jgi:hypothetical protein
MVHDFEEIIFLAGWIRKNRVFVGERFPRISKLLLPRLEKFSTAGFALSVAEEFVLLSVVTFCSVFWDSYYLWMAFLWGLRCIC